MHVSDREHERIEAALAGNALYGDDFNENEISAWFEDEKEGYFSLSHGQSSLCAEYAYSEIAGQHGFRWLPHRRFVHVLGVGCATGSELVPVLGDAREVTILEPSEGFATNQIAGNPVKYVKPSASGTMPFPAGAFDLLVCFSVLHHVPNVSAVVREMFRVLSAGGYALLREPTHSMGDWRVARRGLTKRERGIPAHIFRQIIVKSGFEVVRETRCMFSLISRLSRILGRSAWASPWIVRADRVLCSLPIWPRTYHATSAWHKLRPTAVAYVLRKPTAPPDRRVDSERDIARRNGGHGSL